MHNNNNNNNNIRGATWCWLSCHVTSDPGDTWPRVYINHLSFEIHNFCSPFEAIYRRYGL